MPDLTKDELLELLREHLRVSVTCDTESYLSTKIRVEVRVEFAGEIVAQDFDTCPVS